MEENDNGYKGIKFNYFFTLLFHITMEYLPLHGVMEKNLLSHRGEKSEATE